jgi:two-component system LytT family response regulator
MQQISVIIVDDEPLARQGLALRLNQFDEFVLIAQCADGEEALDAINQHHPDVVFVDIEMPRMNGIELAKCLHERFLDTPEKLPKIVFVTAFKEFALDAFEFQAFDYLLKPISDDRVTSCLNNLKNELQEAKTLALHQQLDSLITQKTGDSISGFIRRLEDVDYQGVSDLAQQITLKSGSDIIRIESDSLFWIEAAGDYMCVHTREGTQIIRKTLNQFEQELNPNIFARVSRSVILNISKIVKLSPNSNGEYLATLCSGDEAKVSRNYKEALFEKVKPT